MNAIDDESNELPTKPCPRCGQPVTFERCSVLPAAVPLCDACEAVQTATWDANRRAALWRQTFARRMPQGYQGAKRELVRAAFAGAFVWNRAEKPRGIGLIGNSGLGKSHALACVLRELETTFLWWSGTEARDAAIDAATADKDREGARRRWEEGMTVPILVLDDISQGRMTEAWSARLFDLLETRDNRALPTFWTSQIPARDFDEKISRQNGGDRAQAAAIYRRLTQHSLVITA